MVVGDDDRDAENTFPHRLAQISHSMERRLAIVGSGPSGLTAARHGVANGFNVTVFERRDAVGGRWAFSADSEVSCFSPTANCQYSAALNAFGDFPPATDPTAIWTQKDAFDYLNGYSENFGLNDLIRLNTEVLDIQRDSKFDETGRWNIRSKQNGKEEKTETFDCVLLCTGWRQRGWRPHELRNERLFKGKISLASEFKGSQRFVDKTVVLIGFGNSASEIAASIGSVAKKVYISSRRSEWTVNRLDSKGRHFDLLYNTLLRHQIRQLTPKLLRNLLWAHDGLKSGNETPKHRFLASLPTFADGLDILMKSGRIEMVENIISFTSNGVELSSKRLLENVDEVIFCTGYEFDFFVLEAGRLIGVTHNDFQLYLHMFHPELAAHPTLACIGFVQPQLGPLWPIAELQSRLFFSVQKNQIKLPSAFQMRADAEWRRCEMNVKFLRTRRHTHIEDYVGFSTELAALLNTKPSVHQLIADSQLALHYITGPLISAQFGLRAYLLEQISSAAKAAGRKEIPRLVAVGKTFPASQTAACYDGGQRHFGENYIQELEEKTIALAELCPEIKWHYIGRVQSKKIKKLCELSNIWCVETVESADQCKLFQKYLNQLNKRLNIFVQVNTSGEENKGGVEPKALNSLVSYILSECHNLEFKGLMTIGSLNESQNPNENSDFELLCKLRIDLCSALNLPIENVELSMGMTNDFELAIKYGSTNVRIGSAIFGSRYYPNR